MFTHFSLVRGRIAGVGTHWHPPRGGGVNLARAAVLAPESVHWQIDNRDADSANASRTAVTAGTSAGIAALRIVRTAIGSTVSTVLAGFFG
jgi:hypothetical protein